MVKTLVFSGLRHGNSPGTYARGGFRAMMMKMLVIAGLLPTIKAQKYWGVGEGWCRSNLNSLVSFTSSIYDCWDDCISIYGAKDIVAVELNIDGSCYCQDDCRCTNIGEPTQKLMTRSSLTSLPQWCKNTCYLLYPNNRTCLADRTWWCCDPRTNYPRCGSEVGECRSSSSKNSRKSTAGVIVAISIIIPVAIIGGILAGCVYCKGCPINKARRAETPAQGHQELVVRKM